jgi:hypothetical protein
MHQSWPLVSFILPEDKSEKDGQPQKNNNLDAVCIILATDVCFLSI